MRGFGGFLEALANLEAAVAWHVNVEDNEIGLRFVDALERRRPIIYRNNFVPGVNQDLAPHVLGGHTVIGQQYFPRQASSFVNKER